MTKQVYSKIDLAIEQLNTALILFLIKKNYVCALTLAGAAEEILGKAVSHKGDKNTLQEEYRVVEPVRQLIDGSGFSWKDFINEKNMARNSVKHMDSVDNETFEVDLEDESLWMLVRACENFSRLGFQHTKRMQQLDEWFYENIIGNQI